MSKLSTMVKYQDLYNTVWSVNGQLVDPFAEDFEAPNPGDVLEITLHSLEVYSGVKLPYYNYMGAEERVITSFTFQVNMTWMDVWLQVAERNSSKYNPGGIFNKYNIT